MKIDWLALGLVITTFLLFFCLKSQLKKDSLPSFKLPSLYGVSCLSFKIKSFFLVNWCYRAAFGFFILAFIDPHLIKKEEPKNSSSSASSVPIEGVAFYLLLDHSSSMGQPILIKDQNFIKTKLQLLKEVTKAFLLQRRFDLIGLMEFARTPQIKSPLTLDHSFLLKELKELKVVSHPQKDGTALGYALFKAIHLISATKNLSKEEAGSLQYNIKSAAIIAITDGIQDPNPLDKGNRLRTIELEEVAELAKKEQVKLYIINIDPAFASKKFAPNLRQMQAITKTTGGKLFLGSGQSELENIYAEIDQLQKSQAFLPIFKNNKRRELSFYPYLIGLGMLFFFIANCLESFYFKSAP